MAYLDDGKTKNPECWDGGDQLLYYRAYLCANQPVSWDVGAKLENSLARSNRSRFG